jgi:hypothetical protein
MLTIPLAASYPARQQEHHQPEATLGAPERESRRTPRASALSRPLAPTRHGATGAGAKVYEVCVSQHRGGGCRARIGHVFGVARGEVVEVCAGVEIEGVLGAVSPETVRRCLVVGSRLVALLTGRMR